MTAGPVHSSPRHRAGRRSFRASLRPSLGWPVAALGLLALVGVHASGARAVAGEGRSSAAAYLLAETGSLPDGTRIADRPAAVLLAGYGWLSRAFGRHASVLGAGRELVVVSVLVTAVLLWATARRLGLGDAAGAVAMLLCGCPLLVLTPALADSSAVLALPPLVLAGCLVAPGRPTVLARVLAVLVCVPAVVLAPDALLLLLAAFPVALAVRRGRSPAVLVVTVVCALAVLAAAVALRAVGPSQPAALPAAAVATAAVVELVLGVLGALDTRRGSGPLPRRLAAPAAALAVTALLALVPAPRASAVGVALPVAALVAGAFAGLLGARLPAGMPRRAAGSVAAALLVAGAAAAVLVPVGPTPDGSQAAALLRWARTDLPVGTRLSAPPLTAAELLRAGAPRSLLAGRTGSGPGDLAVVPGTAAQGDAVLARFPSAGGTAPLGVVDRHPGALTAAELDWRRDLGAALLANPAAQVSAAAAAPLRSGEVDPRLLALLAALAGRPGIGIGALPATPGTGGDARSALITSMGGQPVGRGRPATAGLLAYLRAQQPPFAPDTITVTDDGVLVGYRWLRDPDAAVTRAGG